MNAKGNIKIYNTSANPNLNIYTLLSKFMNLFFTVYLDQGRLISLDVLECTKNVVSLAEIDRIRI